MDHYTHPEIGVDSARSGLRAAVVVTVLVGVLVALSIAGSALWRPTPLPDTRLDLGRAELVSFGDDGPNETIPRVLEFVGPAVGFLIVDIDTDDDEPIRRSGSGFVVHDAGFMITNAHVVEDASRVTVAFANGAEYEAEVYGIHPQTDLAVVKIETDEPLPVAALGDSDALRVGEFVLALGAPFGYRETVTSGIVSGLHRSGLGIARYEDFIVTDAPINRGNSGGPLVNLRGEVVGINTAIIAGDENHPGRGTFVGVGFAIPMNVARVVAQNLIGDGGLGNAPQALVAEERSGASSSDEGEAGFVADRAEATIGQGADSVREAVVRVRALDASGDEISVGSGFIVAHGEDRFVITNAHVVRDADSVQLTWSGGRLPAGAVTRMAGVDLAVIRLTGGGPLPSLEITSSAHMAVSDPIHAFGVRGAGRVVEASGVVTRLDVVIPALPGTPIIETSAATVPGDSGGPLVDAAFRVVGVLVARENAGDGESRRSYAIPLEAVVRVLEFATSPEGASRFDKGFEGNIYLTGLVIATLVPGGVAERAGLRPFDTITAVNGELLDSSDRQQAWVNSLESLEPGTELILTVERRLDRTSVEFRTLRIVYTVPGRDR